MIKNITTVWVERVTWEKLAIELANPKPPFKPIQAGPQIDVWDEGLHGFGLRVGSSGRKTWMVMYRNAEGKKRRVAIGVYDAMNLAAARAKAKLEIGNAANNDGPAERAAREAAEMAALAATEAQEAAETFEAVARLFLKEYVAERAPETARSYRLIVESRLIPAWGPRAVKDVTRNDIKRLIGKIREQGKQSMANRVTAVTCKLFNWAVEEHPDLLAATPASHIQRRKEHPRVRFLSHTEIRAIWQMPDPAAAFYKLMLLTATRPGEVRGMAWRELDLETGWWTIPGSRTKNGRTHGVPLAPQAFEIVRALRADAPASPYLFPGLKGGPRGWPKAWSKQLKAVTGQDLHQHDLRHTATTVMARNGVPKDDYDRILNHILPGEGARVYDHHDYAKEKRAGLRKLDNAIRRIVEGRDRQDAKVVALHA